MVVNPRTGRPIIVGGKTWKDLVKQNILQPGSGAPGSAPAEKPRRRRDIGPAEVVRKASRVAARELVKNPEAYREVMAGVEEDFGDDVGRRAAASAEAEEELTGRLESMLLEDLCRESDEEPQMSRPRPRAGLVVHKKTSRPTKTKLLADPVWEVEAKSDSGSESGY
jgi:hypothetical protein